MTPRLIKLLSIVIIAAVSWILLYFGLGFSHSRTRMKDSESHTETRIDTIDRQTAIDRIDNVQPPHEHVFYLKTHKTGSTTIYAVLAEYCLSHQLLPLLPQTEHFNEGGPLKEKQMMLMKYVQKYDMVFSHHIYSSKIWKYIHDDSFRISTLREPFDNFVSAFLYYRNRWRRAYLVNVTTDDPISEFLRHPEMYEKKKPFNSYTNNRQSVDLGYDLSKSFNDIQYIKEFIKLTDCRFDLVIIMEYFDEGLIMMKRALHWETEDIIYLTKNIGKYYEKDIARDISSLEAQQRKLHAKFSQADIMLYEHFLNRFKRQMQRENGLKEEVSEFRDILIKFMNYCKHLGKSDKPLTIPAGKWNNMFQITRLKCMVSSFSFGKMSKFIREHQRNIFS